MPTTPTPNCRGVLFPRRLPPRFLRIPAGERVKHLVAWWWLSEWDIPDGERSEQQTLAFPASNLVVEGTGVGFCGPTTRAQTRALTGRGRVLAALLQPAAIPAFSDHPRSLRDREISLDEPWLHQLSRTTPLEEAVPAFAGRATSAPTRAGHPAATAPSREGSSHHPR